MSWERYRAHLTAAIEEPFVQIATDADAMMRDNGQHIYAAALFADDGINMVSYACNTLEHFHEHPFHKARVSPSVVYEINSAEWVFCEQDFRLWKESEDIFREINTELFDGGPADQTAAEYRQRDRTLNEFYVSLFTDVVNSARARLPDILNRERILSGLQFPSPGKIGANMMVDVSRGCNSPEWHKKVILNNRLYLGLPTDDIK